MRTVAQLLGVVLAGVGLALVWSPWALVIAGGLLLVGPELVALLEFARFRAADRAVASTSKGGERA